jgi:Zn-finger nucleic acid-binding protein
MLYRNAVDLESEEPQAPEVMSVVEGMVIDIRCSVCDSCRTWLPDRDALEKLLERAARK